MTDNKYNNLFIGLIFVIMGVFYLLERYFGIELNFIVWIFLGGAFLLLYKTKRKMWALIPAFYLLYWGIINLSVFFGADRANMILSMFFIVPSVIFLVMYFRNKKKYMLACSTVFMCVGLVFIIKMIL